MTIDIGTARGIDAETFGKPGERTFRLRIIGASMESASLWMEKEQVQALSLALIQMLAQIGRQQQADEAGLSSFPDVADHDLRIGRMGIGFDPADQAIILQIFELGMEENDPPTLNVRLRPEHCASLNGQLMRIIASGRPVCPLCGSPIDAAGHMCVRANGHSKQPIPEAGGEDEEED